MGYQWCSTQSLSLHPMAKKVGVASAIVIAVLIALLFLPWQQTVKGVGALMAQDPKQRIYTINAPIDGFIDKMDVTEATRVAKDALLMSLKPSDTEYENLLHQVVENITRELALAKKREAVLERKISLQRRLLSEQLRNLEQEIENLRREKEMLQNMDDAKRAVLNAAKRELDRVGKLYKEGIASQKAYDTAKKNHAMALAQVNNIGEKIGVVEGKIEIIERKKRVSRQQTAIKIADYEKQIAATKGKMALLHTKMAEQKSKARAFSRTFIKAKSEGVVLRVLQNDTNRFLKKGEPLILFAPAAKRRVLRVRFSDFNMPLVKKGLPVRIAFYGWPSLQIPGWPIIRFGTFGGKIVGVDTVSYESGSFYAYVEETPEEPWPDPNELRNGTRANVWVGLDVVPIWYQLWRVVNALPPNMKEGQK